MPKLFYMHIRQTLPRLKHHLTSGRKLDTPDDEMNILLEAGLLRDWSTARRLVKSRKQSTLSLFWELSKKRQPDWRRRLRNYFIFLVGGYEHDPHAWEFKPPKPHYEPPKWRSKRRH